MATPTQPLHDEHQELLPHIEQILSIAHSIGETPVETLRRDVGDVYAFLAYHLVPHAKAEDQALYPVVAQVMGAPEATATMRRDHVEVGRLIEDLAALCGSLESDVLEATTVKELRRVLYGLYTLIKVHFAKEEEVYLPILDARLTADEARRMYAAMEAAAAKARV